MMEWKDVIPVDSLKSVKRDLYKLERTYKKNVKLKKINKKLKKEVQRLSRQGKPLHGGMDAGKLGAVVASTRQALNAEAKKLHKVAQVHKIRTGAVRINRKYHVTRNAALLAGFGTFLITPGQASKKAKAKFKNVNYAHRGLHTKDKSIPENSMAAFKRAAEAGYGIELDVQLSKDGKVVVFHDNTLKRVCGVKARVDSKTYEELKKIPLHGTDQTVPLFSDVLDCVNGRSTMLVELKTGKHNRELCKKTLKLLKKYNGDYCIESFDPRIVAWFRFHAPNVVRGQLAKRPRDFKKEELSPVGAFLIGNGLLNFISRPQFVAYKLGKQPLSVRLSEKMGAMRFCWTSREEGNEKNYDSVIFEHYTPEPKIKRKLIQL